MHKLPSVFAPLAAAIALASPAVTASGDLPSVLPTAAVSVRPAALASYEGVVEAVRQTALAAQVAGTVVQVQVQAGDRVRAGQVLLRIDARAANQDAAAGAAQALAARAVMQAATREFARQQQLFAQRFISQAALDAAEARFRSAQAESSAQLARAAAVRTQSDFYVVRAPYDGVVAQVAVVLGDMAMPGRNLLTMYDPRSMRVTAALPQAAAAGLAGGKTAEVELPDLTAEAVQPARVQVLPAIDASSHTFEVRLALPSRLAAVPGMFARVRLPAPDAGGMRLFVPARALARHAELDAVYVVPAGGHALLRQVRAGRSEGGQVEILSGVAAGERVALDPQAAAKSWR
ncbi:MAG TPA: efflux RND transporter periplasmic adaptor subunit [Telluria sp.]|nr:efflux RND transporter periplasmic adaptor subunit [Telluria sp.]